LSHRDNICGELGEVNRPTRRVIFGPILASVAFVLELTLVPLLIPVIQGEFGLSMGELVWVFNSYGLAVAIGVLIGGWFGDAFGVRRIFVAGTVCFALGSLLVALAGSFEALLLGRTLQGFGGGIFSPLIPLLLIRASPNRPGRVLIVWGSVTGYVAAVAPLIYGQLFARHSWDFAFVFLGLLAIGATLLLNGAQADGNDRSQPSPFQDYSQLLWSRNLWMMFGYVFCTYGAITFHLFRLPVWLTSNALDATWIGLTISTIWLSFAALSTFLRNKVDKTQIHKIMFAAPVFIAVGLPLSYFGEARLALLLSSVLVGAGLACSNAPSTQMILKFAPKGMGAISASLDITFARLGGVATVAILAHANSILATAAIGLMCFFAFLCALVSSRPQGNQAGF
jgi:MFS family permease